MANIVAIGVFLLVVIVLPISLLIFLLSRGAQIESTSEGKQFFGRRRPDRDH
jgi:hypothetical protein